MSEDKPQGFVIHDRRSFTAEGERREEAPSEPAAAPAPAPPPAAGAETPQAGAGAAPGARLPPVDFPTFIMSLASSALLHLGQIAGPDGKRSDRNLPLAKHSIDILSMLETKTKGNLTAEEAGLLEELLYDLRLRYVEAAKQA